MLSGSRTVGNLGALANSLKTRCRPSPPPGRLKRQKGRGRCAQAEPHHPEAPSGTEAPFRHAALLEREGGWGGGARGGGDLVLPKDQLLCDPASHTDVNPGSQLLTRDAVLVLVGHHADHAQRVAARHNGGLVDGGGSCSVDRFT